MALELRGVVLTTSGIGMQGCSVMFRIRSRLLIPTVSEWRLANATVVLEIEYCDLRYFFKRSIKIDLWIFRHDSWKLGSLKIVSCLMNE